jgi:hypothetical protein
MNFVSEYCLNECVLEKKVALSKDDALERSNTVSINMISFHDLSILAKSEEENVFCFNVLLDENNQISLSDSYSLKDCVYPFAETETTPNVNAIPAELSEFKDVFDVESSKTLPERRKFDCAIDLVPGKVPPVGKLYNLTLAEEKALKEWLEENLDKGFIRQSNSPFGAPCFFVKKQSWKKDGKLRLCVDYRALNSITVKDRYPVPLISDIIRTVGKGKVFSSLDLVGAFNLLRIKEGDECKTAFLTKFVLVIRD